MKQERFDITGMTCSACANHVEKSVAKLAGIQNVSVNLLKNSMDVSFNDKTTSVDAVINAVDAAGYGATLHRQTTSTTASQRRTDPVATELKEMKQRLIISLLFTLPLFYLSMGHMFGWPLPGFFLGATHIMNFAFSQFLLTLPVVFVNAKYYRTGFKALFSKAPNMDSLIAIGSGAALVYGVYLIYKIGQSLGQMQLHQSEHYAMNLYFESAAMILTLITLGKFFETRAKGKTSDAISRLMDLAPKSATVIRDGVESEIPSEQVVVGDTVVVKAGESIPVDGQIIEGSAYIDESAITGESLPLEKHVGDRVTGATINKSGHFLMQVTRIGEDTTLSQIVKLVDEATSSKAPIARLADTISGIFVPIVISIAIIATVIWLLLGYDIEFALSIGISVLVISCPCALGLATPTAIMVGTGRGAANGILIKSATAIETAQAINTVVLDKTGTVTEGKPVVTDLVAVKDGEETLLLTIAASLEKLSEHPLGKAIVLYAEQHKLVLNKVTDFLQTPGQGISGAINGTRYFAGNQSLLTTQHIDLEPMVVNQSQSLSEQGKTVLYFTDQQRLLGMIAVADVIKKTSRQAVAELQSMGINVVMLTGDNARTAAAMQHQAGIAHVVAEVQPQGKEQQIRLLQDRGNLVAMVGDGINDAPALARADVGIAIGAGTDIAIESADIVLMKSDLLDVVTVIQLSKAVMRNIKQNLFWAFFYNTVGIPIAAGVFYTTFKLTLNPMIAAAAMSLSSVCVVSNALRLRWFTPKHHLPLSDVEETKVMKAESLSKSSDTAPTINHRSSAMTKHIIIEGMTCGHCSGRVEKALHAVPGVTTATVDLASKTATVDAANSVTDEALSAAVTQAGYDVVEIR